MANVADGRLLHRAALFFLILIDFCSSATELKVELYMPKYIECGKNVTLECISDANPENLDKVTWLKGTSKIFQYIKGRNPPYKHFTFRGATIDKEASNDKQVRLINVDFAASGDYSCEVSLETPIFTKESPTQELTVIQAQNADPRITFEKPLYNVGETMVANCTTSRARPPPHITWLINGHKPRDAVIKSFSHRHSNEGLRPPGHHAARTASSVSQLQLEVSHIHANKNSEMYLTCMSTIPGFLTLGETYVDSRNHTVIIDVVVTEEVPAAASDGGELNNDTSAAAQSVYFHAHPSPYRFIFFCVLLPLRIPYFFAWIF